MIKPLAEPSLTADLRELDAAEYFGVQVPRALQASLARHRENLARLVRGLRAAGVDAADIDASVTVLMDSYKAELLTAIKAMMEQQFE